MSWDWMLGLYVAGTVLTAIVLYLSVHLGLRWQRELPKLPIYESLEVLEQRAEEKRLEFEELQERLFEARSIVEDAREKKAWLDLNRERVEDLQRKEVQLREVEEKLAGRMEEYDKVLGQVRELETRRAVLEQQLKGQEDILGRLDDLRHQEEDARLKVAAARVEQEELNRKIASNEAGLRELLGSVAEAQRQRQELMEAHGRLQAEVAQMESERDHLQRQIENLTKERVQVAPPEAASIDERTAALWHPPVLQKQDLPDVIPSDASEEQVLERAVERIADSGLVFAPRTLHAFHTALKVSRESPLLVLAGISGTGKSALPRRYAEAMGMHFLNIAVQPGWDSPMDLLGFYNHLEGRFKPTELTRALVQMDQIGQQNGRWPGGAGQRMKLSDRMLLVLLDEMNLARIEYYFSEFLSRLEIRRDIIDFNVEQQRRASEVLLEIGKSGEGGMQAIPLHVAENVLFVGTMNEDESTQSLSDKVVDRSNVMRFGRPESLRSIDQAKSSVTRKALPFSVWQRWRKAGTQLAEGDRKRLEDWIHRCNQLLDRIRRPFGHRGAQAIREYVRHYPRLVADPIATAMADQVEMRVLPRLRGIDPEDQGGRAALDEVCRLADELADKVLSQAITHQRRRGESHLFLWQGLDRLVEVEADQGAS
ncbi:MAG: AAA family ATPase [Planctomycetes bacterium]|nr:AAA family ATPase [Planctomycetota bacterium]